MRNRHLFRIAVVFIVFLPGFCQAAILADTRHELPLDQPAKFIDTKQHAEEHLARGNYLMQNGELEEAIIAYSRALELNSDLHEALFNRGLARGRHGDLDAAIADLSKYIQIYPDSSLAYTKRGIRKLWKGDIHGAYRDYLKAMRKRMTISVSSMRNGDSSEKHSSALRLPPDWIPVTRRPITISL